jgi:hypothetical protein
MHNPPRTIQHQNIENSPSPTSITRLHLLQKMPPCTHPGCGYETSRRSHLVVHMRKHNKERPYACLRCDYRASKQCKLKQHMRTHTGERPYVCTVDGCAFSSSQPANLSTHHKKSHPDLFICRKKGCTFVTADGSDTLTAHKIVTHKDSASHFTELFN